MSTQNDGNFGAQSAMGWLIAPLAILVALLADFGLDFGLGLEMNDLEPYAVIAIAAVLGMAPRVMKEFEIIHQGAAISLATLVVSLVLAEGVSMYMDSNFLGLIFFIVMFGGYLLDSNGRHEWNTVMIFGFTGLWTAIVAAAHFADTQTKLYTLDGQEYIRTSAWQEATGFVFFNTLGIFVVLGLLAAVLLRGVLTLLQQTRAGLVTSSQSMVYGIKQRYLYRSHWLFGQQLTLQSWLTSIRLETWTF